MALLICTLGQCDQSPTKRRLFEHRHTQSKNHLKTQKEEDALMKNHTATLISDFQPPEGGKTNHCSKLPGLPYLVLVALAATPVQKSRCLTWIHLWHYGMVTYFSGLFLFNHHPGTGWHSHPRTQRDNLLLHSPGPQGWSELGQGMCTCSPI